MSRFRFIFVCLLFVSPLFASDSAMIERMQQDWMYQDHGLDVSSCFAKPSEVIVNNITDDVSTGIAPNKTYTHLLDFGKAGVADGATVNGVQFQKTQAGKGNCIINGTSTNYGWEGGLAHPYGNTDDDSALAKPSGIYDLLRDCNYGQKTDMKLTGLTSGKTYELRIYTRKFGNTNRTFSISFDDGKTNTNITYDYNKLSPHALTFRYIPQGNSFTIKFGAAKENYDIHALTNEQLPDGTALFTKPTDNKKETAMVKKVLDELDAVNVAVTNQLCKSMRDEVASLKEVQGDDVRWKTLYIKACELRRKVRLAHLMTKSPRIIYTKHCVLSGPCQMHPTDMVSDHPYKEQIPDFRPGAQLCMMTVNPDSSVSNEVLLETKDGLIRDPNLSYDATKIVFSMRENFITDDYHLYVMDLADGNKVTQITEGKACSDVEPCFLPDGNIVFQSTRCVQLTDCWPVPVSNLYLCAGDGRFLRRVGFDQVHTLYPQVLENGTVIYTRWEYNDRNPVHQQPLFQMNIDGTGQIAYYGGGEFFPTSIIHARSVPETNKVIAIASGHHTDQRGKLIMVDKSRGADSNAGIDFLAPVRPANVPKTTRAIWGLDGNDQFGQKGELFQYPFALDENNYLVTYLPEGGPRANYPTPFGIYFMTSDGQRELLAFDPTISCGQQIPLIARTVPPVKPSQVDLSQNTGKYYVQDVYVGQGLAGVKRGTVKSMRVVGLEFRAAHVMDGRTTGSHAKFGSRGAQDRVTTPIAVGSGSWDVKHVLGEVPVEEDGSVYVEVPSRTPVFFQLLDEKGYCVQTMRSWTTLQPGETFACIGCHEDKTTSVMASQTTLAMRQPAQKLLPKSYVFGSEDSVDSYLTVNSPSGADGFSYGKLIQPIWDKHCVQCHTNNKETANQSPFDLRGVVHEALENNYDKRREHNWKSNGRKYLVSYLQLTDYGVNGNLINWVDAESVPVILPPYFNGSSQSKLMTYLEPSHFDVKLSPEEKKLVACWIDLCVPFCGSYTEANQWTEQQKESYHYFEEKRTKFAEIEIENVRKLRQTQNGVLLQSLGR